MLRVSQLKTEFLPLLSVSFVSENSVVAAVSVCCFLLVELCRVLEGEETPYFAQLIITINKLCPGVSVCILEGQGGNAELMFPNGCLVAGPRLLPNALQL